MEVMHRDHLATDVRHQGLDEQQALQLLGPPRPLTGWLGSMVVLLGMVVMALALVAGAA